MSFTRRALLFGAGAAIGGYAGVKLSDDVPPLAGTRPLQPAGVPTALNDASLLSETPVFRHTIMSEDPGDALIHRLRT